jgi:hypothetical protein
LARLHAQRRGHRFLRHARAHGGKVPGKEGHLNSPRVRRECDP